MAAVSVDVQPTPNPNALKFNLSVKVIEQGSKSYTSKEAAAESPLAKRIFELPGVTSVFMLGNFVTVNKTDEASWSDLVPEITAILEEELGSGG
jgi:Scaffold protein Nfu/NifU N terminal.